MTQERVLLHLVGLCMLLVGSHGVAASDAAPFETIVRAQSKSKQRRADQKNVGFITAIDVKAQQQDADQSASDLVARQAGVQVRSIGGLGQFSAIAIRGSTPQQVAIFLDGVPLNDSTAGLLDGSSLSLQSLDRIEIFRGYVPIRFGAAAIGGAINLVSAAHHGPPKVHGTLGIGSFGARRVDVDASRMIFPGHSMTTRFGYVGANGDFPVLRHGRPGRDDDRTVIRENNGFNRMVGQFRWDISEHLWRMSVQQIVRLSKQGIAGSVNVPSTLTQLRGASSRTTATFDRRALGPGGHVRLTGGAYMWRRRMMDPLSEVGLGQNDERSRGYEFYIAPSVRAPLWLGAFANIAGDLRYEGAQVRSHVVTPLGNGNIARNRLRHGAGIEIEQHLFSGRVLIVPAIRFDTMLSSAGIGFNARSEQAVSPRAGLRLNVIDGLSMRASVGRYFRTPTVLELYGDRGYVVGNDRLIPETGTTIDAGLILDSGPGVFGAYLQTAAFYTSSRNLIQWGYTGHVQRPYNIEGTRVRGIEASGKLHAQGDMVSLHLRYTLLDTKNQSQITSNRGKPLPGRPRHEMFVRLESQIAPTHHVTLRAFYTLDYISGSYLDMSGRYALPKRSLSGVGLQTRWHTKRFDIALSAEMRNMFNMRTAMVTLPIKGAQPELVPLSDFIGYPLAGRSFWLQLSITNPKTA